MTSMQPAPTKKKAAAPFFTDPYVENFSPTRLVYREGNQRGEILWTSFDP